MLSACGTPQICLCRNKTSHAEGEKMTRCDDNTVSCVIGCLRAPRTLNLSTRWWWVVGLTSRPLYPQRTNPGHCIVGWMGATACMDAVEKTKKIPPCRESNRGHPVCSVQTITTEPSPNWVKPRQLSLTISGPQSKPGISPVWSRCANNWTATSDKRTLRNTACTLLHPGCRAVKLDDDLRTHRTHRLLIPDPPRTCAGTWKQP